MVAMRNYVEFLEDFPAPTIDFKAGKYFLRLVKTEEELDEVLQLRFNIFNLEFKEGLKESYISGRDQDDLDQCFHHLMVIDLEKNVVVGTYRMQTFEMSLANKGLYSSQEFDFSFFPQSILSQSVELGRACVAKDYRGGRIFPLLWKGLIKYLFAQKCTYFFGCCSLPGLDAEVSYHTWKYLEGQGFFTEKPYVKPMPGKECFSSDFVPSVSISSVTLPSLFQIYLKYYGRVCGPPAVDRDFGTSDFLILTNGLDFSGRLKNYFES